MTDDNGQRTDLRRRHRTISRRSQSVHHARRSGEGSAEALAAELSEARDRNLRTLAEMENLRKRTTREIADARHLWQHGVRRAMCRHADNLQRALDAVPAEAKAAAIPA